MATYLIINSIFLLLVMLAFMIKIRKPSKTWLLMLVILLLLTAVFDSAIVGFGIVAYDSGKISGILIGKAPAEDFFYAVLAAILVPTIWKITGRQNYGNN